MFLFWKKYDLKPLKKVINPPMVFKKQSHLQIF